MTDAKLKAYNARLKGLSNWCKYAGNPSGEGASLGRGFPHDRWASQRKDRTGYADAEHPFRHQGSADINTYKMFLELNRALLRDGGILGVIVPSGVYTDKGSTDLRELFLKRSEWLWLFGFENRQGIFDIHRSFKFCPVIVRKGGTTKAIRAAFMRHDLRDWEDGGKFTLPYAADQVERFSPHTRSILEVRQRRDLEVLEKIYANSVLLGDQSEDGWGLQYAREFDMTNDSKLFPPRPKWEEKGYKPDPYGRWIGPDGDVALPLYEGRMIGQFDFSQKGWVSGRGRSAVWRDVPWVGKVIEPQFLMAEEDYREHGVHPGRPMRLVFMDIGPATNQRSMISGVISDCPAGNKVPILTPRAGCGVPAGVFLCGTLNSYVYDFQLRNRLGGLTLNYFVIEETALPAYGDRQLRVSSLACMQLTAPHVGFAPAWLAMKAAATKRAWQRLWALTHHERLRLRTQVDAVTAELYGMDYDDLCWILRDCDQDVHHLREKILTRTLDPKGFWRIDKDKDPELRHTVLSLAAFHDLIQTIADCGGDRDKGIQAFCSQNDGEGWMLPETLCLADLGLGHDDRAKRPQPVRERLGERFLPWQLEQSVEESWAECEQHAKNILGEDGFAKLEVELRGETAAGDQTDGSPASGSSGTGTQKMLFPVETDLFGDVTEERPSSSHRRRRRR